MEKTSEHFELRTNDPKIGTPELPRHYSSLANAVAGALAIEDRYHYRIVLVQTLVLETVLIDN